MQANTSEDDEVPRSPIPAVADSDTHAASTRACETCRTRKTKCDREYPCLQCRRSGIECRYATTQPRPKRTRVLITPQYERKIDLIENRLGTITKLLKDFKTNGTTASTSQAPEYDTHSVARTTAVASSPNLPESVTGPGVEGDSSLSAQSAFVVEFLQDFIQPDPEIRRTLDDLSNIVSDSRQQCHVGEPPRNNAISRSPGQQKRTELPPFPKVAALIRLAKAQRLAGSGWVYEYITMQSFGDLCLEVYYSDEPSLFDCISVYAGLFSLFWDYASIDELPEIEKEQSLEYSRRCQNNLDIGLAELPLQLPASSNVVATLLFACFYAIGCSKPLLCWSLACKASEICPTLGYHRKPVTRIASSEMPKYTQFLFWTTYYVDKTLSLRLGRASTIPNWEISIDLPTIPNSDQEPVLAYFVLWTKLARIQGNIYEMLYSPGSILLSIPVRQSRVDLLRKDLEELEKETQDTMKDWYKVSTENSGENLMEFYATSDAVLRLSLLTHVCRAAPRVDDSRTTFDPYCVEVARATIEKHHDCMAIIRTRNNLYFSTYVHWTLLFAPFVPFIVIFCNAMETRDQTDLARLDAFVQSIQSASTVSVPAAKMQGLFQVLHKIAARYIALTIQSDTEESHIPETDAQLAAIGFPHARGFSTSQQPTHSSKNLNDMDTQLFCEPNNPEIVNNEPHFGRSSVDPMFWMGNGAQLENWFYDNQMSIDSLHY